MRTLSTRIAASIILAFFTLRTTTASNCIIGFLDDTSVSDPINRLAFTSEAEKYDSSYLIRSITTDRFYDTLSTVCDMLDNRVVAFLGPQVEENFQIVHSVSYSKDIPLIETRWNDNPQNLTFAVNLYPHAPTFSKVLAELVDSKQWTSFAVFYDDHQSLSRISGILKVIRKSAISIKQLVDPTNTGNYRQVLKEAWKDGFRKFVLDCHIDILPNVLQQAQQIGLMTMENAYIITNPDLQTIDMEAYKYSDTNITGISMVDSEAAKRLAESIKNKQNSMAIHNDIQHIEANQIRLNTALLVDGVHLLNEMFKSLPYHSCDSNARCSSDSPWYNGPTALSSLKEVSFNGITGHVKLNTEGYRQEFQLDIIELRENGLVKVGSWDAGNGISFIKHTNNDINLDHLRVITALTAPYGMLKESEHSLHGNDRYEGYAIDLIHELSLIAKFNYTFIIRDDKANGDWNNVTKKWSGMIGDVKYGDADLAIADLTITSERAQAVDFTTPFMHLGVSILYKKPSKAPPDFFSFAAPYAFEVWVWIGGAYFITSISLFIMGRLCASEWTNPYPCVENPEYLINQFSLRNSFWFMLGSILQQGSEIAPIAYATRMTAGTWWFFTLILVSTYTANLAAFLTTEIPDIPFSNVRGLLEKAPKMGIEYGAKAKGATLAFFKGSENPDFKKIFEHMDANQGVMVEGNDDGVRRADNENYAFFMESVSIEYEIQRYCNLTRIGDTLDQKGYGIAMRKNSTYRHTLNTALLKLQESGKTEELRRKWWEERRGGGQCGESAPDDAPPLSIPHVYGVFLVTVYGTLLAIVLVFFEMFIHIMKESIRQKKPFCEELKEELKFYVKCKGLVKPVRKRNSNSKSPTHSETLETQNQNNVDQEEPNFGYPPDITNSNF